MDNIEFVLLFILWASWTVFFAVLTERGIDYILRYLKDLREIRRYRRVKK